MIVVDTNVVVRLLTQDDELQFNKSVEIFREQAVFIPDTVILQSGCCVLLISSNPPMSVKG
jgi:predicted nucleic-acid-binding protein